MLNFKIGIISDWLGLPFEDSMSVCRNLGADGVQMYAVDGFLAPENLTDNKIKEIKKIIDFNGLEVSALCGDLGGHGFCIASDNARKIEKSKRIVDLANKLGTNVVTTHIGVIPSDDKSERYKIMQDACNKLAEYAHKNNVYFAVETGPEPAQRLKDFLDSLDSKGVAVNLDPANLVMVTGDDPVKAVYTLKDYIVHTHAKDGVMLKRTDPQIIYDFFAQGGIGDINLSEFFTETPFGEGSVDFDKYLLALQDIGYTGYLTVERETGNNAQLAIKNAVEFLKKKLG